MEETKRCGGCKVVQPLSEFNKHSTNCGTCRRKYADKYNSSQRGFFMNLLKSARGNASRRSEHRENAGIYDLTYEYVLEMWETQGGLCFYSKIPMVTQPLSDYQCSLERLDPELGYIKENVVLCCLEFNHSVQWSLDKMIELFAIKDIESDDYLEINFDLEKKPKTWNKAKRETIDGVPHKECPMCKTLKPPTEYTQGTRIVWCKICAEKYRKEQLNKPRPHVLHLLQETKTSTKYRNKKITKQERKLDYDIDFDFVVDMYRQQKGRCAYSKVPLAFGSYREKNWIMSIERIDPLKGYTRDNVCLVALEFNTKDSSCMSEPERVKGSSAWSKTKFEYFEKTYKAAVNL